MALAFAACLSSGPFVAGPVTGVDEPAGKQPTGEDKSKYTFSTPVRLTANGKIIQLEQPGYAAPCWADIDGDGTRELLVGQYRGGKIRVYRNRKDNEFAVGDWLQADGGVAEVPGVW